MQAIPSSLKEIIFRVLKTHQPGGLNERAEVLWQLFRLVTSAKNASEALEMLRLWERRYLRAEELKLNLPDPLLQVSALEAIMKNMLARNAQASFRVAS